MKLVKEYFNFDFLLSFRNLSNGKINIIENANFNILIKNYQLKYIYS